MVVHFSFVTLCCSDKRDAGVVALRQAKVVANREETQSVATKGFSWSFAAAPSGDVNWFLGPP